MSHEIENDYAQNYVHANNENKINIWYEKYWELTEEIDVLKEKLNKERDAYTAKSNEAYELKQMNKIHVQTVRWYMMLTGLLSVLALTGYKSINAAFSVERFISLFIVFIVLGLIGGFIITAFVSILSRTGIMESKKKAIITFIIFALVLSVVCCL